MRITENAALGPDSLGLIIRAGDGLLRSAEQESGPGFRHAEMKLVFPAGLPSIPAQAWRGRAKVRITFLDANDREILPEGAP